MDTWNHIITTCCAQACEGRINGKCPFRNKKHRKGECSIIQAFIDEHDLHMQLQAEDCDIDFDEDPQGWLDANC